MGEVLFLWDQTFYFIGNKNAIFVYWCCLCNIFFQCFCHGLNTLGKLWHTCSKACGTWKYFFCLVMFYLCVSFFKSKYLLKIGCKPNLYSNPSESRKFSFLLKVVSSKSSVSEIFGQLQSRRLWTRGQKPALWYY